MNRMTEKTENGYYVPANKGADTLIFAPQKEVKQRYEGDIGDRLGAYEDCGLEPEEVCKMEHEWTQYETAMSYVDEIGGLEALKEICAEKKYGKSKINKITQWTAQDIADAKFIIRMFGTDDVEVSRLAGSVFELKVWENGSCILFRILETEMLPSLAVGQTIKVDKIAELGDSEQNE